MRYDASPALALRASAGAGFRPPFLNELVRGYFIGNVAYEPNPQLVPERSATRSAGIDVANVTQRFSVDAFDTTVSDAIMFRTIDATHQLRSNVARTRTDGYTASYTRAIGTCARVSGSFTDQYARVTAGPEAIVSKRLQYVPQQSASIDYTGQIGAVSLGASLTYLGQTYADDLNTQPLGVSMLVGTRIGVPLAQGVTLDLSGENLAGARYLSSIDRFGLPTIVSLALTVPVGSGNNGGRTARCT